MVLFGGNEGVGKQGQFGDPAMYQPPHHGHQGVNRNGQPAGGNDAWKDMLRDAPRVDFSQLKDDLEGPKPLRALATVGGIAMLVAAGLRLLNLGTLIMDPCRYIVDIYMGLFGICVVIIELKQAANQKQGFNKNFIYKWMPFTAVIGGKGLAYIFFGTLGFAGGWGSLLSIPGAFVAAIGVVYCLIHFSKCESLEEKYDKSLYYSYRQF